MVKIHSYIALRPAPPYTILLCPLDVFCHLAHNNRTSQLNASAINHLVGNLEVLFSCPNSGEASTVMEYVITALHRNVGKAMASAIVPIFLSFAKSFTSQQLISHII